MSVDAVKAEEPGSRTCLVTVTSDGFLPGTLVLLHTFQQHHPAWRGDLVVVHDDGLSESGRAQLAQAFGGVGFVTPSAELVHRLDRLVAARPDLAERRARFLSLEAFRLEYDRVLFVDSDVLIRAPLDALLARDEPFLAAGDGPYYWGGGRDRATFERLTRSQLNPGAVRPSFNAGLMAFAPAALAVGTYEALLARLDPAGWLAVTAGQTDQRLLNLHLEADVTMLPAADNFLLAHRAAITEATGVGYQQARVLHYNNQWKPWQAGQLPEQMRRDALAHATWRLWYDAYFDTAQALYLRANLPLPSFTHG